MSHCVCCSRASWVWSTTLTRIRRRMMRTMTAACCPHQSDHACRRSVVPSLVDVDTIDSRRLLAARLWRDAVVPTRNSLGRTSRACESVRWGRFKRGRRDSSSVSSGRGRSNLYNRAGFEWCWPAASNEPDRFYSSVHHITTTAVFSMMLGGTLAEGFGIRRITCGKRRSNSQDWVVVVKLRAALRWAVEDLSGLGWHRNVSRECLGMQ